MYSSIVNERLWWARNVTCVTIIPSVSLICEIVEGNNDEHNTKSRDAPSSYCWHCYGKSNLRVYVSFNRSLGFIHSLLCCSRFRVGGLKSSYLVLAVHTARQKDRRFI